jgi:hypothetical protein
MMMVTIRARCVAWSSSHAVPIFLNFAIASNAAIASARKQHNQSEGGQSLSRQLSNLAPMVTLPRRAVRHQFAAASQRWLRAMSNQPVHVQERRGPTPGTFGPSSSRGGRSRVDSFGVRYGGAAQVDVGPTNASSSISKTVTNPGSARSTHDMAFLLNPGR